MAEPFPPPHTGNPEARESAAEMLRFLAAVADDAQRRFVIDARPMMAWALLVAAGAMAELMALAGWWRVDPLPLWAAVIATGWGLSLLLWHRAQRRSGAQLRGGGALASIWSGTWIAMTLLGFGGALSGLLSGAALAAALQVVLASACWSSASLLREPWLRACAGGWWLAAALSLWLPRPAHLVVLAVAMLLLMAWPAWRLPRRWQARAGA